jgi:hypothetical protein
MRAAVYRPVAERQDPACVGIDIPLLVPTLARAPEPPQTGPPQGASNAALRPAPTPTPTPSRERRAQQGEPWVLEPQSF